MSDTVLELREMASNGAQPDCDIETLKRAADEIERLRSTEFKGLGMENWTCPHCRKQSNVGPFTVTMKL